MDINEVFKRITDIAEESKRLLKETGYMEYGEYEADDMEAVKSDPDLYQKYYTAVYCLSQLEKITAKTEYLKRPVKYKGILYYDYGRGRYCMGDREFHCGDSMEVLLYDNLSEHYYWAYTWIEKSFDVDREYNKEGYYLANYPWAEMEGLEARVRG